MNSYYERNFNLQEKPNIREVKDEEVALASMNEYVVASKDKPIIGTYALASCVGILINDHHNHYALGHILNDYENIIMDMLKVMVNDRALQVTLIPGFYTTEEKLQEIIDFLHNKDYFLCYDFDIEIKNMLHFKSEEYEAIELAYDARSKEFINVDFNELIKERGR